MRKFFVFILVLLVSANLYGATTYTVTKDSDGNVTGITTLQTANGTDVIDTTGNTRTGTFDALTSTTGTITTLTSTTGTVTTLTTTTENATTANVTTLNVTKTSSPGVYEVDSGAADQGATSASYDSVYDLLSTIGSNQATLRFKGSSSGTVTYTFTSSEEIPANVKTVIEKGAVLSDGGGAATLTITGPLECGIYQVFDWTGSGSVVFGLSATDVKYPEWWGNNTTPGTTDMSVELQAAITSTTANSRIPVILTGDTYYIGTTSITLPVNGITIKGNGSTILYAGTSVAFLTGTSGSTRYDMEFSEIEFETDEAAGAIDCLFDMRGISRTKLSQCRFKTNGNDAVWIGSNDSPNDGSMYNTFDKCQFNMESNGYGYGIYMDNSVVTSSVVRDCVFRYGDSQILLCNDGGTAAGFIVDSCVFEGGDVCIEIPQNTAKNVSIINNYSESYDESFLKSDSPVFMANNRQSSPGTMVFDITSFLPDMRISSQDEYSSGILPIPNLPGKNLAVNSSLELWDDDDEFPFGFSSTSSSNVTFEKDATNVLIGEYAAKVTTTDTAKLFTQSITNETFLAQVRGKRAYFCVWVKTATASSVRLTITDDGGNATSLVPTSHPGDDEWHYLVATKIIDDAATYIDFSVRNYVASSVYYIDSFCYSFDEPVSLYATYSDRDLKLTTVSAPTSVDLSGSAATQYVFHNNTGADIYINTATLLYTEASSADTGITIEIGTEADADFYYTGTTEVSKSQFYSLDVTLLKNILSDGDTITFTSAGSKSGTGEIRLIVSYLSL